MVQLGRRSGQRCLGIGHLRSVGFNSDPHASMGRAVRRRTPNGSRCGRRPWQIGPRPRALHGARYFGQGGCHGMFPRPGSHAGDGTGLLGSVLPIIRRFEAILVLSISRGWYSMDSHGIGRHGGGSLRHYLQPNVCGSDTPANRSLAQHDESTTNSSNGSATPQIHDTNRQSVVQGRWNFDLLARHDGQLARSQSRGGTVSSLRTIEARTETAQARKFRG
mmetsp:Transcript_23659/g.51217  ORF Transcript_23659/g.51217 Transcript_23659/m.51217 type:complete len:220 (-) Transcript_23659:530-1189(-)